MDNDTLKVLNMVARQQEALKSILEKMVKVMEEMCDNQKEQSEKMIVLLDK